MKSGDPGCPWSLEGPGASAGLGVSLCVRTAPCGPPGGVRGSFARLCQLPGVFFKFQDSKGIAFGFLFYALIPKGPHQPWRMVFLNSTRIVKSQKRSQAIILTLSLCLPNRAFQVENSVNYLNFTRVGFTPTVSCKTPHTSPPSSPLFLKGRVITVWQMSLQHPFEKSFKTQSLISVFCPHVANHLAVLTFLDIPELSDILWIIAEFFQVSSES